MSNRRQDNPNRRDPHVSAPAALLRDDVPISITNSNIGNLNRLLKAARLARKKARGYALPHNAQTARAFYVEGRRWA